MSFLRESVESLEQTRQQPLRRSHVDAQRDPRRAGYQPESRSTASQSQRETPEDLSRRERLQRVLARLNRLHDPSASSTAAYTNRTPSPTRQSLYDWAPAHDENEQYDNELDAILNELRRQQPDTHPDILRVLSQSQLDGHRQQRERHESANVAPANDMTDAAERRTVLRDRERRRRENEWVSLRSRAVLQRARQEGGGSPSATERMLRYVMDRERSGMSEEEERARGSGWFRPSPSRGSNEEHRSVDPMRRDNWMLQPPTNELRERDRQERVEAFRRGYLAENVPPRLPRISTPPVPTTITQPASSLLENALKYMSELRSCTRYEEALSTAMDHGLATKEFFADKHDDFVMDLEEVPHMQYSSWLQAGATFEGNQQATTGGASFTQQDLSSRPRVEQINPNYRTSNATSTGFDHPPGSTRVVPFDVTRSQHYSLLAAAHAAERAERASAKEAHDQWPVRVVIHSVDAEKMTLQGTMEAYDVPQHPSNLPVLSPSDRPKAGKKNAPITTYLEGHIIDLRIHSFLTSGVKDRSRKTGPHATSAENSTPYTTLSNDITFPSANARTDAQNWMKLPPFSSISSSSASAEDTVARHLLSKAHLETLNKDYIFMRWKEKCFIHTRDSQCSAPEADRAGDQDRGHGLTISGFYYVSLRRSDGWVEGLYFDPMSTPYQSLRLSGANVRGGWGAWAFR